MAITERTNETAAFLRRATAAEKKVAALRMDLKQVRARETKFLRRSLIAERKAAELRHEIETMSGVIEHWKSEAERLRKIVEKREQDGLR